MRIASSFTSHIQLGQPGSVSFFIPSTSSTSTLGLVVVRALHCTAEEEREEQAQHLHAHNGDNDARRNRLVLLELLHQLAHAALRVDHGTHVRRHAHLHSRLALQLLRSLFTARLRNVEHGVDAADGHLEDAVVVLAVQAARLPVQGTLGSAALELYGRNGAEMQQARKNKSDQF